MSNSISSEALHKLLGIPLDTPLSIDEMCKRLKPVIYPAPVLSGRLELFCQALVNAMESLGITVLSENEASGNDGRFAQGTVIFAPGYFPDNLLAINRVATKSKNARDRVWLLAIGIWLLANNNTKYKTPGYPEFFDIARLQ